MARRDAQLAELFEQIISSPRDQHAQLVAACRRNDPSLANDLESLLSAHEQADSYFEEFSRDVLAPAMSAAGLDETYGSASLLGQLNEAVGSDYAIEREIVSGGMGRVFTATELRLGRKVVIKTLPQATPQAVSVKRFRREIQLAARLQNSHIVPVLTTGAADGFLYYVMPYVEGETLRARLSSLGALSVEDALAIWRDVLDALGAAHRAGIVHRDIKPENILLSGRNALVADFGIARAIEISTEGFETPAAGVMVGTPAYMAPEQMLEEGSGDHRIDIYAAGLVMYEMLSGNNPFSGTSVVETLDAQRTRVPPTLARKGLPSPIASLVTQCLEKVPAARPATVESILEQLDRARVVHPRETNRRMLAMASVPVAAVAIASFAAFTFLGKPAFVRDASRDGIASAPPSLLVFPLANASGDSADASLSDGMTQELIGALSRDPNLRVISGSSASSRGSRSDARVLAQRIGAANVLAGSMWKIGPRLRMDLRLVNVRDGSTRWSKVYDADMENVFAIQNDIAERVSAELDVGRRGKRQATTPERYTPNIAAYEWYLRGMDVSLMRSRSGNKHGIEYFNKAIAVDPKFAAAYAGLARLYLQVGNGDAQRREWFARSESAAVKAVALDDSLAEPHVALGWVMLATGRMERAEAELKTAAALNPAAPRVHEGLARLYLETGRTSEELAEARAGLASDPLSYSAIREMALALNMNKRCDESLRILAPLKSLSPPAVVAGIIAGQCYAYKQMWPQALAEFQWADDHGNSSVAPAFIAYALARAGREDEARKMLSDMLANRIYSRGAFGIGIVYAGLKDYDHAFEWLGKGVGEAQSTQYILDPMFEDLQRDARFGRLRLNLYAAFQNR